MSFASEDVGGGVPTVDLSNCEKEPIHIPGHAQSCGVLVAVNPATHHVRQISENCHAMFGVSAAEVVDKHISSLVDAADVDQLVEIASELAEGNPLFIATVPVREAGQFHLIAHNYQGILILEFERAPDGVPAISDFHKIIRAAVSRLKGASGLEEFAGMVCSEMQLISGFDRVMLYQFQEDLSGKVIAEVMAEGLKQESFLGLRYPASDIPAQARQLFLVNIVRVIPDIGYTPAALVPQVNPDTGKNLDMTHAYLRGVSPIHIEYLQNMGVNASLTLALERDGQLWGLIACHHYSQRVVDYTTRSACEFLAHSVALQLASKEDLEHADYGEQMDRTQARLLESLAARGDMLEGLTAGDISVAELIRADGVAVISPQRTVTLGTCPDEIMIQAITGWLQEGQLRDNLFQTTNLLEVSNGVLDAGGQVSGLLALKLGRYGMILWFRKEQVQEVTWAGNPQKPVEASSDGMRLSPRKSFAVWTEQVRNQSLPWLDVEVRAVRRLEMTIKEIVLRKTEELEKLNEELEKSNLELDSFAYIASHDLKEPLRGIHNYSQFLKEDYGHLLDETGLHRLNSVGSLSQRMESLLDSLLYYSRAGRVELSVGPIDLNKVVADVCALLQFAIEEKKAKVSVPRELPTITADRARIGEVFFNLISNALKYTESSEPSVEIGWLESKHDARVVFYVKDNGIGIQSRNFEAIFRIFRRLHGREKYGGGTGAGLAITKKIIQRHHGEIWVESEPGTGTTFYFTLQGKPSQVEV